MTVDIMSKNQGVYTALKSAVTFRTILYLLRQIPSKLNDLDR